MRFRSTLTVILVVLAAAVAVPATASAKFFSPGSFWNSPLAPNAALDSRSPAWVTHLRDKVTTYGQWINTDHFSSPIYTVPADAPRTWVWVQNYGDYNQPFMSVPMPANPVPSNDTDHHIIIWQPSTDQYFEFWNFYKGATGYGALAGGRIDNASTSTGIFPNVLGQAFPAPYGATASSLAEGGGLITAQELQTGNIDHVVQIAIPHPLHQWWWTWPAQRSDGDSIDACDVPEGARFRLPANVDVASLGLSPVAATIARAVQKYGMVVQDTGGAVVFAAEDPMTMSSNPYPTLFGGKSPAQVLAGFPWSKLQALQSQPNKPWPAPNFGPC